MQPTKVLREARMYGMWEKPSEAQVPSCENEGSGAGVVSREYVVISRIEVAFCTYRMFGKVSIGIVLYYLNFFRSYRWIAVMKTIIIDAQYGHEIVWLRHVTYDGLKVGKDYHFNLSHVSFNVQSAVSR